MKLTQKQAAHLRLILNDLERAHAYINKPTTILAVVKGMATTTLDFTLPGGRAAFEVDKEIGSNLTGLAMGISKLTHFLANNS